MAAELSDSDLNKAMDDYEVNYFLFFLLINCCFGGLVVKTLCCGLRDSGSIPCRGSCFSDKQKIFLNGELGFRS